MITPVTPQELVQRVQELQNAQTTLASAASAQVKSLPAELFNLLPGSTFSATISQVDARSLLTLSTDVGSFQLRLSVPQDFVQGSQLTLQVGQIGDQSAQFRIVTIDGQPFVQQQSSNQMANAVAGVGNMQGGNQAQADAAMAAAQVRQPASQIAGITATVIAPADPAQVQQSTLMEPWQPGTQLAVRIVAVAPPAPSQVLAAQSTIQAQPLPIPSSAHAPTELAAAAAQTTGAIAAPTVSVESQGPRDAGMQFGTNPQGRQPMPQPPQAPPPPLAQQASWVSTNREAWAPYSPTLFALPENPSLAVQGPPAIPQLLSGTVAPNTANGFPVVSTSVGMLVVETSPLPPGTKLSLEVVGQPVPPQAAKGVEHAPTTPYAGSAWPAMEETVELMKFADASDAQRLVAAMPSLSPRLAANLAGYIGAVRQGDVKGWLGERNIETIERKGGKELLGRIEKEFGELAEVSQRPRATSSGTWTSYVVPMMNGQHIEPIQLNVRNTPSEVDKDGGQGGNSGKGGGQRFVVDLNLSRLGPMQIDGLVRGAEKKIDFIFRTQQALPSQMRYDLNRIVDSLAQASGLIGSIVFQASARFVDTPKLEVMSRKRPGVTA